MLITRASEYAILSLIVLSKASDPMDSESLSRELSISKSFLAKILQALAKKEILKSYKGVNGGFALIKNPKLLLLDDCLSAVDTETEEHIINNFSNLAQQKTSFIVSHRISSVKKADIIFVLEEGQIIQQGNHQELLNQDGYYQDLFKKQLQRKEL